MLMRWDPFRELERATERTRPLLAMDAYQDGEEVVIHLDVPGVGQDGVDLTVERNEVRVSVRREWEPDDRRIMVQERPQGSFTRSFLLSDGLDVSAVAADLDDGVLTIRIPVAEASKPRQIDVKGAARGSAAPIEAESREAGK